MKKMSNNIEFLSPLMKEFVEVKKFKCEFSRINAEFFKIRRGLKISDFGTNYIIATEHV